MSKPIECVVKGKIISTLFKMGRKSLFKTIAIVLKAITIGRGVGLNPKYNKDSWEFTANEQSEGVSGWKIAKRRHQE